MVSRLMVCILYCLRVSFLFVWLVSYLIPSCLSYCTDYERRLPDGFNCCPFKSWPSQQCLKLYYHPSSDMSV